MLEQLRHPPAPFADAVRRHFALRGGFLDAQIKGWVRDTEAFDAPAAARMETLRKELATAVAALPKVCGGAGGV